MRLAAITLAVVVVLGLASSSALADHGWDYSKVTTVGHYGHPGPRGYHGGFYRHYGPRPAPVIVVPMVPRYPVIIHPPVHHGYGGYRYGYDPGFDFHYRGRNFGFSFGF